MWMNLYFDYFSYLSSAFTTKQMGWHTKSLWLKLIILKAGLRWKFNINISKCRIISHHDSRRNWKYCHLHLWIWMRNLPQSINKANLIESFRVYQKNFLFTNPKFISFQSMCSIFLFESLKSLFSLFPNSLSLS